MALSKEALKMNGERMARMAAASEWTCSSLSMTQGPAMSVNGAPVWAAASVAMGDLRGGGLAVGIPILFQAQAAVFDGCADEGAKEGMRFERLRFELGVELAAEVPGMISEFADFDVDAVRGLAGELQAALGEDRFVFAVELEAVAVAFADMLLAVGGAGVAALGEMSGISAEAHRAAEFVDAF